MAARSFRSAPVINQKRRTRQTVRRGRMGKISPEGIFTAEKETAEGRSAVRPVGTEQGDEVQ